MADTMYEARVVEVRLKFVVLEIYEPEPRRITLPRPKGFMPELMAKMVHVYYDAESMSWDIMGGFAEKFGR